jgi:hypothetical protein
MHFLWDDTRFLRQSQPNFQDRNVSKNVNKNFDCFEVFGWLFVLLISSTSSISSSTSMVACWKRAFKTSLVLTTEAFDSGLATPSLFDYGRMKVESIKN